MMRIALALSKSKQEAGGLLYYDGDRMSSLKIFDIDLPGPTDLWQSVCHLDTMTG